MNCEFSKDGNQHIATDLIFEPRVTVTVDEVETKTFGLGVSEIDVIDKAKDKKCRFWVTVKIKDGKPVLIVSTKNLQGQEKKTDLTGVMKPAAKSSPGP